MMALPESLKTILNLRTSDMCGDCPTSVQKTIGSIPFFKRDFRPAPAARGWRSATPSAGAEDGFEVYNRRRRGGGGGYHHRSGQHHHAPTYAPASAPAPVASGGAGAHAHAGPRFGTAAFRASVDIEDRILARIKGKINKIGPSTYESTKTFMQQILNSDETEFLDEFIKFIFKKAALEPIFCPLYAKLLHELADEFPHLRTVMMRLFADYTDIFKEVDSVPDVGTADYAAFLEAQERKKFRRGYSQFVSELVKLGEADKDAFARIVQQIVDVLETSRADEKRTLLCEEYIDCLMNMCTSAAAILSAAPWFPELKTRLEAMSKMPKASVPGLTNKARFAIMDIIDFIKRGWKAK